MASQEYRPDNNSQHIDFRVFVYRLDIPGSFDIGGKSFPVNRILSIDAADPDYPGISAHLNQQQNFQSFLRQLYEKINSSVAAGIGTVGAGAYPALFSDKSIFRQLDITPLVTSVQTSMRIEEQNTASITTIDPQSSDFGLSQLQGYLNSASQARRDESPNPFSEQSASHLQGFAFREFDLVRVMTYARTNEPLSQRMDAFGNLGIGANYCLTPQFTGLVASVTRSSTPGSVPSMNAACIGISRVFTQTVTVFNQALGNVLLQKGDPNLRFLSKNIAVTGNAFQGKTSDDVFLGLINDYLYPQIIKKTVGGKSVSALGVPSLSKSFWENIQTSKDSSGNTTYNIIPFLPMLVMYHIVKYMNAEPIFMMDDMLDERRRYQDDDSGLPSALSDSVRTNSQYRVFLQPYLIMSRDTYQMFDSSYMAPADIFSEIRSKTFYEIFEDRTGAMHFRFPRYNSANVRHTIGDGDASNVSFVKDDSAIYNATVSQNMLAWNGRMDGVAGSVFIDRFSIMRFGMRAPQIVENPNAADSGFSTKLSAFMRSYYSARSSRRATVSMVANPGINLGEQVVFSVGGDGSNKSGNTAIKAPISSDGGGQEELMIGYITGIDESISVSGEHTQTLSLAFVRPVSYLPSKGDSSSDVSLYSTHDAARLLKPKLVNKRYTDDRRVAISKALSEITSGVRVSDTFRIDSPEISDYLVSINSSSAIGSVPVTMQYVQDPYFLAAEAAKHAADAKKLIDVSAGLEDPGKLTLEQKKDMLAAQDQLINSYARVLCRFVALGRTLTNASLVLRDGTKNFYLSSPNGLLAGTGKDISGSANRFKERIARSHVNVSGSVAVSFSNDPSSPRTFSYSQSEIVMTPDTVIRISANLYNGADGAIGFQSQYRRLFSPPAPQDYNAGDVKLYNYLLSLIIDNYMPIIIEDWSQDLVEQNPRMQEMLSARKALAEKLGNTSTKIGGENISNPANPVDMPSTATLTGYENDPTTVLRSND